MEVIRVAWIRYGVAFGSVVSFVWARLTDAALSQSGSPVLTIDDWALEYCTIIPFTVNITITL